MRRGYIPGSTASLFGREMQDRIVHAKRLGDAAHQVGVAHARAVCERLAQQPEPRLLYAKGARGDL